MVCAGRAWGRGRGQGVGEGQGGEGCRWGAGGAGRAGSGRWGGEVVGWEGGPKSEELGAGSHWADLNDRARGDTGVFLTNPNLEVDAFVVCIIALSGARLMAKVLAHGGIEADKEQEVQALEGNKHRSFRGLDAHNGVLTDEFYLDCDDHLHSDAKWAAAVPPSKQSETLRGKIVTSYLMMSSTVWFLLTKTYEGYPFKLFRLIDRARDKAATALELDRDRPCLWDPFTKSFRDRFKTAADLVSELASNVLMGIALLLRLCVSRIECRHAALRRLLKNKGFTWLPQIMDAGADWTLMRQRVIELAALEIEQLELETQARQAPYSGHGWSHGGLQRAIASDFLSSDEAKAMPHLERMAACHARAAEIREKGGLELQKYIDLAEAGTKQSKANPGRSSFGGTAPRDKSKAALIAAGKAQPPPREDPLAADFAIIKAYDASLNFSMLDAKTDQFLDQALKAKQDRVALQKKRSDVLSAWRTQQRRKPPEEQICVPSWAWHGACLKTPWSSVEWGLSEAQWVPSISLLAERALINMDALAREELDKTWTKMHKLNKVADAPSKKRRPKYKQRTRCFMAGFCLCAMRPLQWFVSGLTECLRPLFPKGAALLGLLQIGMVWLKSFSNRGSVVWCHLRVHDRRSFECSVTRAEEVEERTVKAWCSANGFAALRIVYGPQQPRHERHDSLWSLFRDIDFAAEWSVQLWTPISLGKLLRVRPAFIPADVTLEPIRPGRIRRFWGGKVDWGTDAPLPAAPTDPGDGGDDEGGGDGEGRGRGHSFHST